jgi:hypothetical protein
MSFRVEGARIDSMPHRYRSLDQIQSIFSDDQSAVNAISLFLREDQIGDRSRYVFRIVNAKSGEIILDNEQILARIPRSGKSGN